MIIQRMNWAGLVITIDDVRLMVDPIFESAGASFFGRPQEIFKPLVEFGKPDAIAVTHLHSDHFDADAILESFGENIPIFVPFDSVTEAKSKGLKNVKGLHPWECVKVKNVDLIAAPSVDGLGDPQVAWIIKGDGKTFFHGGDTLWHGYWWKIQEVYGPFDGVALPINGAVVQEEGLIPSGQPICMGPEQAVSAASILKASRLIPIHFGSFHHPPIYLETPNALGRLKAAITPTNIQLDLLKIKEEIGI